MRNLDSDNKKFTQLLLSRDSDKIIMPNHSIVNRIDQKRFSLDANDLFYYKPEYLAYKEFKNVADTYSRRIAQKSLKLDINDVFSQINDVEKDNKTKLINIAEEIIRDVYEVPRNITFTSELKDEIKLDTNQKDNIPSVINLPVREKNEMLDEIQKRVILNGLVHGSSMNIWTSVHYIAQEKLNNLDNRLIDLYDKFTALTNYLFWHMNPDMFQKNIKNNKQITLGYNKINFLDDYKINIECAGMNFAILLHELNKGVLDSLICHGIPKDYSTEQMNYYYSKADRYENEYWLYLLVPALWRDLLEVIDLESRYVPQVIMKLSKLSYRELVELFKAIIDDKKQAKTKMKQWNII